MVISLVKNSEEMYSKSIIKTILEEHSEDIFTIKDYGTTELLLSSELKVYELAFPSLNMGMVEQIVREYLYHHNYLEYVKRITGKLEYEYDGESDSLYLSCSYDLEGDIDRTVNVDGLYVDLDKEGLVVGVEILGVKDALHLDVWDDCFVKNVWVDFVRGDCVLDLNVGFLLGGEGDVGRLRQYFSKVVLDDGFFGEECSVIGLKVWCGS